MDERGESISGLWSSESSIYPRFGYGVAAESYHLEADAGFLSFDPSLEPDEIRFVDNLKGAPLNNCCGYVRCLNTLALAMNTAIRNTAKTFFNSSLVE